MELDRAERMALLEESERNLRDYLRCWYARAGYGYKELIPCLGADRPATGESLSAKVFGRIGNTGGRQFIAQELTLIPSTDFTEALFRALHPRGREKETDEDKRRREVLADDWQAAGRIAGYVKMYLSLPEARRKTLYDIVVYVDASAQSYGCVVQFAKEEATHRMHRRWDRDPNNNGAALVAGLPRADTSATRLELAAATQALKHAEVLYGLQTPRPRLVMFSDCQGVVSLFRQKSLRGGFASFNKQLSELTHEIDELRRTIDNSCFAQVDLHYIPGEYNLADPLSRKPLSAGTLTTHREERAVRGHGITRVGGCFVTIPLRELFVVDNVGNPKPNKLPREVHKRRNKWKSQEGGVKAR